MPTTLQTESLPRTAPCNTGEDRIYAAATDYSETLSFAQLRAFFTEALCWRRLLTLRH